MLPEKHTIYDLDDLLAHVQDCLTATFPGADVEDITRAMGIIISDATAPFRDGDSEKLPVFVRSDGEIIARIDPANDADAGLRVLEIEET
ncbi:hypothetical protein JYT11_00870, partial [Planctomycetaceae bacterium AH-315-I19]|nr:hypothetical protein [Planctomycetaceae bacterium AH-315-I19]